MRSKLMFCSAPNTLITTTLQTYGALVGVQVNRQKNHRHRIGYVRNIGLWRQTDAECIFYV